MALGENRDIYESQATVENYSHDNYIFSPETVIIKKLISDNINGSMLDIGMGAGRTTKHFSNYFNKYIGLDYSQTMVSMSKKQFANYTNCEFITGDARSMSMFLVNSFDFILFSFNGIDCVSTTDREIVLKEVFRVAKPGAMFFFSFHNSYNIPRLFSFQFPKNPLKYVGEYKRVKGVRSVNSSPDSLLKNDFVEIVDGDLGFKAQYVYAKPLAQRNQLESLGFENIALYRLKSGDLIASNVDWQSITDEWIHVSCTVKK